MPGGCRDQQRLEFVAVVVVVVAAVVVDAAAAIVIVVKFAEVAAGNVFGEKRNGCKKYCISDRYHVIKKWKKQTVVPALINVSTQTKIFASRHLKVNDDQMCLQRKRKGKVFLLLK